jgi:hypothetical protein
MVVTSDASYQRNSMIRMISGIGIPTSQSRIGMVLSPSFDGTSESTRSCRKLYFPRYRREDRRLRLLPAKPKTRQ